MKLVVEGTFKNLPEFITCPNCGTSFLMTTDEWEDFPYTHHGGVKASNLITDCPKCYASIFRYPMKYDLNDIHPLKKEKNR